MHIKVQPKRISQLILDIQGMLFSRNEQYAYIKTKIC
jgi:hypothetical protein